MYFSSLLPLSDSFSLSFSLSLTVYTSFIVVNIHLLFILADGLLYPNIINLPGSLSDSHSSPYQSPVWVLYFLDSGGGTYPELVYDDQIEWYIRTCMS